MKAHIIVKQGTPKTNRKLKYEVFHIVESKDVLGKPIYVKQSVGVTAVRNLKSEIKEYELQIEYRKRVISEIRRLKKSKKKLSDVEKVLKEFKAERKKELENEKKKKSKDSSHPTK